ncbi:MAG TPA: FtsX-like permease family protein, partial [Vicinamibacterales bacterium]|nr:FtsX-like permease family protein [Vicinamibacterales bacterium]
WQMLARLAPGATLQEAQRQIDDLNARNLERFPALAPLLVNAGFHTPVFLLHDELVSDIRPTLSLLWVAAVFVLLIGALNVANLVSVRATTQVREFATRLALGASFASLTRQIVIEALVLTSTGGALGLLLGTWALQAAPYLGMDTLPRGGDIGLDGAVAAYTAALVVAVGGLVTALPVLRLRHVDMAGTIREEGRSGTASRRMLAVRRVLVGGQVAFALVLLVGAGMLLASFAKVLAVDPGFRADGVLTGRITLPVARYGDDAALAAAYERLLPALRAIPGVAAAGLTSSLPFGGDYSDSVIFAEGYQMTPGESVISPAQIRVSEGLMEALGMQVVRGRMFDARDGSSGPQAVIVDERLARKFWPDQDPIGRRMYFPSDQNDLLRTPAEGDWLHVVGVVREVRLQSLTSGGRAGSFGAYYRPLLQSPVRGIGIALRTEQSPEAVSAAARQAVQVMDGSVPLYDVKLLDDRLDLALTDRRTPMILAVSFAAVALLLAAVGLYGVLAYQVAQRSREIGIRLALGATAPGIFQMVLREGALVVGAGAAAGLGGAWLLRAVLQAQLYEVDAMDPRVLALVTLALTMVALVACVLPARRAASTDPAKALVER